MLTLVMAPLPVLLRVFLGTVFCRPCAPTGQRTFFFERAGSWVTFSRGDVQPAWGAEELVSEQLGTAPKVVDWSLELSTGEDERGCNDSPQDV